MFSVISRGLRKPLAAVDRQDIERFVTALSRNEFLRENGKPYSGSTKSDIKKFLRQFYRWLFGNGEIYPPQVAWIKTRIGKDERPKVKEVLQLEEVRAVATYFRKPVYTAFVYLLFDSGFRVRELLSVRKSDLLWEDYKGNNKCFWVRCNSSKTELRKVPVPLFTKELNEFISSLYYKSLSSNDLIFPMGYSAILHGLTRVGLEVLKRPLTPHVFRHSSATYYAKLYGGNSMLLAQRFGWSFSSKELATYIRRSGVYEKEGVEKVYSNELMTLHEENQLLKESLQSVRQDLQEFKKNFYVYFIKSGQADKIYKEYRKVLAKKSITA